MDLECEMYAKGMQKHMFLAREVCKSIDCERESMQKYGFGVQKYAKVYILSVRDM